MQLIIPITTFVSLAAAQMTRTVAVGDRNGGLIFTPDSITAEVGDTVEFVFGGGNHTATEASFDGPCNPIENGFNSGFTGSDSVSFSIVVQNTDPVYFYCALGRHCQAGMVGAINPPSSGNTLEAFRDAAVGAEIDSVPSEPFGGVISVDGSPASTAPGAAQTSSGATTTNTRPSTTSTDGPSTNSEPPSTETTGPSTTSGGDTPSPSPTGNGAMALGGDIVKAAVGAIGAVVLLM